MLRRLLLCGCLALAACGLAAQDEPQPSAQGSTKEKIKHGFKEGGKAVGHAALTVGHAVRAGAKAVGRGARKVGHGVKEGAKETGHGIKAAVKGDGEKPPPE